MGQFDYAFSIVMAVYNVELFLREAIESLVNQTIGFEKNVQLILVNDGSTDSSGTICENYAERYPQNIVVIHKENGGVSTARNAGLPFVKGKYVNFFDSDDKLTPNTLADVYKFFETNYDETDLVTIPMYFFDGKTGEYILNYKFRSGTRVIDLQKEYDCIQLSLSSSFIKLPDAKAIRFDKKLRYEEDAKECLKILIKKMKIGVITGCQYLYRRRTRGELSAVQKGGTTKDWYMQCVNRFVWDILNFSYRTVGFVPEFVQYTITYDLQWRIKQSTKQIKYVLSEEEFTCFKDKIYEILQHIDDRIILEQKNIFEEHKCYLLSKKYGVAAPEVKECNQDIAVCIGQNLINKESETPVTLSFLREHGKNLIIEGIAFSLVPEDLKDRRIYLSVNNQMILCEVFRIPVKDVSCLGDVVLGAVGFMGIVKDYEKCRSLTIKIYSHYKGIRIEKKKLRTGKFFPVTASVGNAYAYWNGYILEIKENSLTMVRGGTIAHIRHEYAFLKQLRRINSKPAKKAIIARCAYHVAKLLKRETVWLISDRVNKADDNGEAFFKFLNEKKAPEICYFVIGKDSSDYETIKRDGKVLDHFSGKHKFFHLLTDVIISAAGDEYVANPYGKFSKYYQDILARQKRVFLQHGITKDDLSDWLNRYNKNFDMFVTAARPEYESILACPYYYGENVVKLTGFPRFDRLRNNRDKIITIMPTWRWCLTASNSTVPIDGLRQYDKSFKDTVYFRFYDSLLNNKKLIEYAEKYNYIIQFMPHPNLISHIGWFNKNNKVRFCSIDTKYRDVFAESALIVTDYSSVAFDFAYLRKPVLYCQFDRDDFFLNHTYTEGYFDYERDGFGEVSYNQEDLIQLMIEYMKCDCALKDKYKQRMDNFFAFNDRNNCQRVYEAIKSLS